jgi:hypothetical protein
MVYRRRRRGTLCALEDSDHKDRVILAVLTDHLGAAYRSRLRGNLDLVSAEMADTALREAAEVAGGIKGFVRVHGALDENHLAGRDEPSNPKPDIIDTFTGEPGE